MPAEPPIVLITPEARATLEAEAEAERTGTDDGIVGGLLFGYPVDVRHRMVIGAVRVTPEEGFGRRGFCLSQSRTSAALREAQRLSLEAHYCGVWFVHYTPDRDLTDEEWQQVQGVLEDPDYCFQDAMCLVVCLDTGKLSIYAASLDLQQVARGQAPAPTRLKLTTETSPIPKQALTTRIAAPAAPTPDEWYKAPDVASRLNTEHKWLLRKYRVESAIAPDGKVVFRLMQQGEYEDIVFYLACGPGFPGTAPTAFLMVRGDRYPLLSPALSEWSADKWLFQIADDLVRWQVGLLDQQVDAAEDAIKQGNYQEASDLLAMVLLIDPRKARAAQLLSQVSASATPAPSVPASPPSSEWYVHPQVVDRLQQERDLLQRKYRTESTLSPDGKVVFRLMPKSQHGDMVFYLACGPGFPDEAPTAFLVVRGDRYPLLSPALNAWSADRRLVDVADDLIAWQVTLLDQQVLEAEAALKRGEHQQASDLLAMVLLIEPRRPNAARLLAEAQALLEQQRADE